MSARGAGLGVPVIRCQDCTASWGLTDRPAPCFTQGHRAELNGVPVEFNPALDAFGREADGRVSTPETKER